MPNSTILVINTFCIFFVVLKISCFNWHRKNYHRPTLFAFKIYLQSYNELVFIKLVDTAHQMLNYEQVFSYFLQFWRYCPLTDNIKRGGHCVFNVSVAFLFLELSNTCSKMLEIIVINKFSWKKMLNQIKFKTIQTFEHHFFKCLF